MKKTILLALLISIGFISCDKEKTPNVDQFKCEISNPEVKENRLIGIDLLDLNETNNFDNNIAIANELRIDFIALHALWTELEPTPGNLIDPEDNLKAINAVAKANNFKFSLTIRPIDLTGKTVPSDLENTRFNNPEMVNRFIKVIDFVFNIIEPENLTSIQIGNEIDGYDLSNEPDSFWDDYGFFLYEMWTHIHNNYNDVKVGFTGTYAGMMQQPLIFNALAGAVDVLGVTYYPLKNNFDVKEPNIVISDMNNLVNTFPMSMIYLQEVGFQSSKINDSNENKQAEFFCHFFTAWDMHKDKIKLANIVRLNDYSDQIAKEAADPYGFSNNEFTEYLRTLGVRSYGENGSNKQAYETIKRNLQERGW